MSKIAEPSIQEIQAALDESDIYVTILMSVLENKNSCTRCVIDRACSQWLEVNEKLASLVEQLKNAQDIWYTDEKTVL